MQSSKHTSSVPSVHVETDNSNIKRHDFPKDFLFGVGTSAYQHEGGAAEGGRSPSIWDTFAQNPSHTADGSNGNVSADMYTMFQDDIPYMKRMGFYVYRFSLSWSRILPGGWRCHGVNQQGIDYYNQVIDTVLENGMTPFVTLFHWDLPQCLEQNSIGGFLCQDRILDQNRIVNAFVEYAELCFEKFGDRVKHWMTFNESWTFSVMGYVLRNFAPGNVLRIPPTANSESLDDSKSKMNKNLLIHRAGGPVHKGFSEDYWNDKHKPDPAKDAYTVARNILLAHGKAVQSYRSKFQVTQKGIIGITLVCNWCEPRTDQDQKASKRALDFMLGWFLEPIITGKYPKSMEQYVNKYHYDRLEPFSAEESALLKGSIDFLGINYYTARYVADNLDPHAKEGYYKDQILQFYTTNIKGKDIGVKPDDSSDLLYIVPLGIYKLLKYVKVTYGDMPIYITENGIGEKNNDKLTVSETCVDPVRIKFYQDHLANLLAAMTDNKNGGNVNVKGFFAWSYCDNFEWSQGYTLRTGIMYVDFINDLKRYPKASADWFAKFLSD